MFQHMYNLQFKFSNVSQHAPSGLSNAIITSVLLMILIRAAHLNLGWLYIFCLNVCKVNTTCNYSNNSYFDLKAKRNMQNWSPWLRSLWESGTGWINKGPGNNLGDEIGRWSYMTSILAPRSLTQTDKKKNLSPMCIYKLIIYFLKI